MTTPSQEAPTIGAVWKHNTKKTEVLIQRIGQIEDTIWVHFWPYPKLDRCVSRTLPTFFRNYHFVRAHKTK